MPRVRSLLSRIEFDTVKKAHDCQGNAGHRLERGSRRMKVRNGRSWDHYCLSCAQRILEGDFQKLQVLQEELDIDQPASVM